MSIIIKRAVFAILLFSMFSNINIIVQAEYKPVVSAKSAILINAVTGNTVYEKNSLEIRSIASTTKIMTTLLTLEAGDLDTQFTVDSYAIRTEGTSMGLREGDIVTRRALCYGMLLPSGNDAANAAAVSVSGNITNFVKLMNEKAAALGMKNTQFKNPSGLDAEGHYSTAYDMALLTMEALKNPLFREMCGSKTKALEYGNPPYKRTLNNNNKLLDMYSGCIGVKTGFTDDARRCLVSAAEINGVLLIAVTLNAPNDWQDHSSMFDYGFSIVNNQIVDYDKDLYVNIAGGSTEKVRVKPGEEISLPLSDDEMRYVTFKSYICPFIYSGFDEGESAGELYVYYNGIKIKTIPLVTAISCFEKEDKLSVFAWFLNKIKRLY